MKVLILVLAVLAAVSATETQRDKRGALFAAYTAPVAAAPLAYTSPAFSPYVAAPALASYTASPALAPFPYAGRYAAYSADPFAYHYF